MKMVFQRKKYNKLIMRGTFIRITFQMKKHQTKLIMRNSYMRTIFQTKID